VNDQPEETTDMATKIQYHLALQRAQAAYRRTGDHAQYLADCGQIALELLASSHPEYGTAVSLSRWLIKGLIAQQYDALNCPIDADQCPKTFLTDLADHVRHQADADLAPLKNVLIYVGALRR